MKSIANSCKCSERKPDQKTLEQIGDQERTEFFNGKAEEVRTHFICQVCGTKWEHLVESGVGGHGNFWSRE